MPGESSRDIKEEQKFFRQKNPSYNECLVDLQVDISDAEMLNPNAKYWEKETNDRIIA
jgi:hypothetical protein